MPLSQLTAKGVAVLRAGWRGLLGQCLTFSAMLLPLFFKEFAGVSFQIVAGAGAGVAATFFTLSFSSVFPRLRETRAMRVALWCTLTMLASGAVLLLLLSLAAGLLDESHLHDVLLSWALMGTCQGAYMMGGGASVRFSHYSAIATGRLVYGTAVFLGALVSCLVFSGSMWALTLSACLAQALAAVGMWWGLRHEVADLMVLPRRGVAAMGTMRRYIQETGHAAVSTTLTGLAGVMNVFILPTLGVFHDAWTTLLRMTGGVMTVSLQLISPAYDAQMGEQVRAQDREGAITTARRELLVGLGIALVTVVVSMAAMVGVNVFTPLTAMETSTVVVLAIVYILAGIGISVLTNTLILLGGDTRRLVWASLKTAVMGLAILLGGGYVLHATVAVEVVTALVYVFLVRRELRRMYTGSHRRAL